MQLALLYLLQTIRMGAKSLLGPGLQFPMLLFDWLLCAQKVSREAALQVSTHTDQEHCRISNTDTPEDRPLQSVWWSGWAEPPRSFAGGVEDNQHAACARAKISSCNWFDEFVQMVDVMQFCFAYKIVYGYSCIVKRGSDYF